MDILDKINIYIDEDRMAGMSTSLKKSYERKKYRKTKHQKKNSLEKLERSGEGKKCILAFTVCHLWIHNYFVSTFDH